MATGGDSSVAQALNSLAGILSPLLQSSSSITAHQSLSLPPVVSTPVAPPPRSLPVTSSNSNPSRVPHAHILPSYLRKKQGGTKPKKPNRVQTWDRDIICLPLTRRNCSSTSAISYPRGRYRSQLGSMGLIGKIRLTSEMNEQDIKREICTVFEKPMGGDPEFPFVFLQPAGEGSRTLVIPAQSATYQWSAQQVARLGGEKNTTYILAQADMPSLSFDDDGISDDDHSLLVTQSQSDGSNTPQSSTPKPSIPSRPSQDSVSRPSQSQPPQSSNPLTCAQNSDPVDPYSQYVDLIDLTKDDESESDNDLPVVHIPRGQDSEKSIDQLSMKHILIQHQQRVIFGSKDEDIFQRINIRRSHIFKDAFKQFSKLAFDVTKMLHVVFVGEQAQDGGGPRREFFRLLMRECFEKSGLFTGYPDHVVPLHSIEAVDKNKFTVIGRMVATCLIQGGQSPSCFAKAVADHIIYNFVRSNVCIEDIPDIDIQQSLQKILLCNTDEQLQSVLNGGDFNFLFTCGYNKPTSCIKLSDKDTLVRSVWLHYVIFNPHAELEQLSKGISDTLRFDELIIAHPDSIWGLLVFSKTYDVTAEYLSDTFAVNYSDNGSNNRTKEEAIILFWMDYIFDAKDREDITLSSILQFYTGSSKIPPTGFPEQPKIRFISDKRLPSASTCDLTITFPRYMGTMEEDEFRDKMDFCILGSYGFGVV